MVHQNRSNIWVMAKFLRYPTILNIFASQYVSHNFPFLLLEISKKISQPTLDWWKKRVPFPFSSEVNVNIMLQPTLYQAWKWPCKWKLQVDTVYQNRSNIWVMIWFLRYPTILNIFTIQYISHNFPFLLFEISKKISQPPLDWWKKRVPFPFSL
jgi:hypothetical protein